MALAVVEGVQIRERIRFESFFYLERPIMGPTGRHCGE